MAMGTLLGGSGVREMIGLGWVRRFHNAGRSGNDNWSGLNHLLNDGSRFHHLNRGLDSDNLGLSLNLHDPGLRLNLHDLGLSLNLHDLGLCLKLHDLGLRLQLDELRLSLQLDELRLSLNGGHYLRTLKFGGNIPSVIRDILQIGNHNESG